MTVCEFWERQTLPVPKDRLTQSDLVSNDDDGNIAVWMTVCEFWERQTLPVPQDRMTQSDLVSNDDDGMCVIECKCEHANQLNQATLSFTKFNSSNNMNQRRIHNFRFSSVHSRIDKNTQGLLRENALDV